VGSDSTEKMKIAKYSLVYQRLLLEGIIEDEEIDNHAIVSASVEQIIAAKWCYMIPTTLRVYNQQTVLLDYVTYRSSFQ